MRCIRFLISRSFDLRWGGIILLTIFFIVPPVQAQEPISIILTSNLQGKFSIKIESQEKTDPLLLLAQNIVHEFDNGADLYLDLGNAFYPGVLSKYSMGSAMIDFLDYFSCAAVLVSSKDLQVGTNNLEFLQKDKRVRLLSANIVKENGPIFTPWLEVERQGTRIAVLGISSSKIEFDIAEKDLFGYALSDVQDAVTRPLAEIKAAGIDHIILLSGMNLRDTVNTLESNAEIDIALCGGDYTGHFFSGQASRMDLDDGRSVIMTNEGVDYFRLDLIVDDGIDIASFEPKKAEPRPTDDFFYTSFKNRLTLWKEKFIEDEVRLIANLNAVESSVDDARFTQLLRDRFDCEVAIVEENTINPSSVNQSLRPSDFLSMVNRDYFVFTFSLTGKHLKTVASRQAGLVITGLDTEQLRIQGYPLVDDRLYRVAATQPAMRSIRHMLRERIAFSNTWMTVTDLLKDDLGNEAVVLRDNFDYLDRRFRTTIDAYFSNFIDNSGVKKGDDIEVPAGQPANTYNKWGLEDKIDLTLYNEYHRFVFTPYMLYSRNDDDYLNNILRGTFLYEYNLFEPIRPYNKFRCDTVVEDVDGLRPIVLRETLGISVLYENFTGKLGFGFEKEVQDPAKAGLYGLEVLAGIRVPFLSYLTYAFDLDVFAGIQDDVGSPYQIRSEINNAIAVTLNSFMYLSFRHKYFYFYEGAIEQYYQNSQFIVSLDLINDWKFW